MSKTISEIYTEYKIMPNLQEHMLRVAGVASLICDNFDEPLNKEEIITACLLHDMGNIIKFKLEIWPQFLEPEGLKYWQNVQSEFKNKYGNNEYLAHGKIANEIGINNRVLEIINAISFLGGTGNASSEDFGKKIAHYCDDRVSPFSVVSLKQRFTDLRKRYAHHGNDTPERDAYEVALRQIEEQIFSKCKIKPEDINNDTVAPIISELRNFVIRSN